MKRKLPKMESFRKRTPDYTDLAYREAVNKLKYLLAESYTPITTHKFTPAPPSSAYRPDKRDESYSLQSRRALSLSAPKRPETTGQPPPELIAFIDRQEEYIEQLEKESHFCREELTNMMSKVKEVIAENDTLHQQRKEALLKSVFDTEETEEDDTEIEEKPTGSKRVGRSKPVSGANIMLESRISELEAQLTQCRMELRKAQEQRSSHNPGFPPPSDPSKHFEALQRERDELSEQVTSLQSLVTQLREKEANASQKVKRSLDVVDQAQFEKNQVTVSLEMEVRRLKTELERVNEKQRETLQEASRRIGEAERRYATQIERLNSDLASQWDTANRLNLELDRARRTEQELRREVAQRNQTLEELKKELTTKTTNLQSEALSAGAERENLEAELNASRLAVERAERCGRQEAGRLTAEAASLRQRLDRADADLLHARKENIRLNDNISMLEKELSLAKLSKETKDPTPSRDNKRDEELTSMIKDIDAKHVRSVADLENMIQSQTQLMEKLKDECQNLTQRLEDSSTRHKEDRVKLAKTNDELMNHVGDFWENYREMQEFCQIQQAIDSGQMTEWWEPTKGKEQDMLGGWSKETLGQIYPSNEKE